MRSLGLPDRRGRDRRRVPGLETCARRTLVRDDPGPRVRAGGPAAPQRRHQRAIAIGARGRRDESGAHATVASWSADGEDRADRTCPTVDRLRRDRGVEAPQGRLLRRTRASTFELDSFRAVHLAVPACGCRKLGRRASPRGRGGAPRHARALEPPRRAARHERARSAGRALEHGDVEDALRVPRGARAQPMPTVFGAGRRRSGSWSALSPSPSRPRSPSPSPSPAGRRARPTRGALVFLVLSCQALVASVFFAFALLASRSGRAVLPVRDHRFVRAGGVPPILRDAPCRAWAATSVQASREEARPPVRRGPRRGTEKGLERLAPALRETARGREPRRRERDALPPASDPRPMRVPRAGPAGSSRPRRRGPRCSRREGEARSCSRRPDAGADPARRGSLTQKARTGRVRSRSCPLRR